MRTFLFGIIICIHEDYYHPMQVNIAIIIIFLVPAICRRGFRGSESGAEGLTGMKKCLGICLLVLQMIFKQDNVKQAALCVLKSSGLVNVNLENCL